MASLFPPRFSRSDSPQTASAIHSWAFAGRVAAGALALFCALSAAALAEPSPTPPESNRASPTAVGETSRAVLALNLQNSAREITQTQEETKGIETLLTQVRAARDILTALNLAPDLNSQVAEVQAAYARLKEQWRPANGAAAGQAAQRFSTRSAGWKAPWT